MDSNSLFTGIPPPDSQEFGALVAFCEAHRPAVLASLPFIAAELAEVEGFAGMMRFIRSFGGHQRYVPTTRCGFQQSWPGGLKPAAQDQMILYANSKGQLDIPSSWGVYLALRRTAIFEALSEGQCDRAIASKFGSTQRNVRRLRKLGQIKQADPITAVISKQSVAEAS